MLRLGCASQKCLYRYYFHRNHNVCNNLSIVRVSLFSSLIDYQCDSKHSNIKNIKYVTTKKIDNRRKVSNITIKSNKINILQSKINDTFKLNDNNHIRQEIIYLLQVYSDKLDAQNITLIMYNLGKKKINLDEYIFNLFIEILSRINMNLSQICKASTIFFSIPPPSSNPSHKYIVKALFQQFQTNIQNAIPGYITPAEMSMFFYSFKDISTNISDSMDLLTEFNKKLRYSKGTFNAQDISMIIYGMQNFPSKFEQIKQILLFLIPKFKDIRTNFTAQGCCMTFFGFKNMHGRNSLPIISNFLYEFVKQIEKTNLIFDKRHISMILCGLRYLQSNNAHMLYVLKVISMKILDSRSTIHMDNASAMTCFFAIRRKNMQFSESRTLLKQLCLSFSHCLETINLQTAANLICSLQTMSIQYNETRIFLRLIINILIQPAIQTQALTPNDIALACFGFQRISTVSSSNTNNAINRNEVNEVNQLLQMLPSKFGLEYKNLSIDQIGRILFGLRHCSLSMEWLPILQFCLTTLLHFLTTGAPFPNDNNNNHDNYENELSLSDIDCIQLLVLTFIPSTQQSELYNTIIQYKLLSDWIKIKVLLLEYIDHIQNYEHHHQYIPNNQTNLLPLKFRSQSERFYARHILRVINQSFPQFEVKFNYYLYGFEADIVILYKKSNQNKMLNIEIDGIHHQEEQKIYFCHLRDSFLFTEYQVKIVRIDATLGYSYASVEEYDTINTIENDENDDEGNCKGKQQEEGGRVDKGSIQQRIDKLHTQIRTILNNHISQ